MIQFLARLGRWLGLEVSPLKLTLPPLGLDFLFMRITVYLLLCQYLISILQIPLMISLAPLGTHTLLQLQSATQLDGTR